jgi:hypothetical protein
MAFSISAAVGMDVIMPRMLGRTIHRLKLQSFFNSSKSPLALGAPVN